MGAKMSEVEIEALRPFNRSVRGDICEPGDTFPVSEARAVDLVRLGLARRVEKEAPETETKVMPARSTKAAKLGG